jgi:hypothetical protein
MPLSFSAVPPIHTSPPSLPPTLLPKRIRRTWPTRRIPIVNVRRRSTELRVHGLDLLVGIDDEDVDAVDGERARERSFSAKAIAVASVDYVQGGALGLVLGGATRKRRRKGHGLAASRCRKCKRPLRSDGLRCWGRSLPNVELEALKELKERMEWNGMDRNNSFHLHTPSLVDGLDTGKRSA